MNTVDVSIIIPVYNVAEYLATCLESVIKQTIKSKEIIIINDGSTDGCYEILAEYKKEFPELIIINQENRGISETRNAGLRAATGEYIAFVDSDDFVELNMFEKMYLVAKRENADVVIGDYILYNDITDKENLNEDISDKEIIDRCISDKYEIEGIDKEGHIDKIEALKMFLLNDIKAYVWNKIHKREIFTEKKIMFPNFKVCEDTPVGFLLLAGSNKIYSMGEPLYYYRQRETSLTKTFSIKSMEDMLEGCYIMRDYLEKNPLLDEKLKDYYRVYLIKTLWAIHNKYFLKYCQTGQRSNYTEFRKIVSKQVKGIKISELIGNKKLTLKDKVNALLIKTGSYGLIFPILYKLRNQKAN
ncbi:glycosyltransferase family 2 protein [Clostridium lacusfryxellense]|uniref:glycosyltransferase family 2 protein n=1 Tax=Clostridium lacusfryxellense TaxID=205328 RepID=UPI001C0BD68E|nr:glycosyltransferase [Clostridium lacusfryxellense]MBU3111432.1 glycosyltransferase [Clostridium lacusfryxellense]